MDTIVKKVENVKVTAIEINEGNGYFMRAYTITPLTNTKRGITQIVKSFETTMNFVVVEWEHPNYGYFADAGFFWKSMHADKWNVVPIVSWMEDYKTSEEFIKKFPDFKELFEE